jgi:hypothetical protein
LFSEPAQKIRRRPDLNPEAAGSEFKVSFIMRHNCSHMPADGSFENRFVARVCQLGPPRKPNLNWLNQSRNLGEESVHVLGSKAMPAPLQDLLIFQE